MRAGPGSSRESRIWPAQHRGFQLTARSEQRSRCTVLQITAETLAAICTPSPSRISMPPSAPPAPQSPQPPSHPSHNLGNTGERPKSGLFQAGQAKMVVPEKIIFWEISTAPGLPPARPAVPRSRSRGRGQAAPRRRRWLHGQPVL